MIWPGLSTAHFLRFCWRRDPQQRSGGQKTGRNPTDRGKSGSKRHLIVDAGGTLLSIRHTAAHTHETTMLAEMVHAIPAIRRSWGRQQRRLTKLHADRVYDSWTNREQLRQRDITLRIAQQWCDGPSSTIRYMSIRCV